MPFFGHLWKSLREHVENVERARELREWNEPRTDTPSARTPQHGASPTSHGTGPSSPIDRPGEPGAGDGRRGGRGRRGR